MNNIDTIKAFYGCNVTPTPCDLFVMLGTSLMNGYTSTTVGLDAVILAYYFPSGDQVYCQRYGTNAPTYSTPTNNKGQFIYMNTAYNYDAGSFRFGPDTMMAKELYTNYNWPRPMFFFHHEQAGASIIAGETTPSWAIGDSLTYPIMATNLLRCVNILKDRGFAPRISVMWGSAAVTSTTDTAYRDSINAIISGIRTLLGDNTIKFLWGKNTIQGGASAVAYRDGVDLVLAADNLVNSYDYDYLIVSGDHTHPTTQGNMDLGLIFAGYWNEVYNEIQRPTVSNVVITGTLQNTKSIGFSYDYSGSTENTGVVTDVGRLKPGTGTRCELFTADDVNGLNVNYLSKTLNKGETNTLVVTTVGKYLRAVVFPKAQSGSIHGYPVKSAWYGPVVA